MFFAVKADWISSEELGSFPLSLAMQSLVPITVQGRGSTVLPEKVAEPPFHMS